MFTKSADNSIISQKREGFRQEIRKQDVESYFYQKRLAFKQSENIVLPPLEIDQLIPSLQEAYANQNYQSIQQLHLIAFRFTCENDDKKRNDNLLYLINHKYMQESLITLNQYPKSACDVFRTLANTCQLPEFYSQSQETIKECLSISFLTIQKTLNSRDLSDVLVFIGNIAAKSLVVCQEFINYNLLIRLVEVSKNADVNLIRNICFCLHVITKLLDENKLLQIEQRIQALQIILNAIKLSDSDMIHCEILHPLTVIYDVHPQLDEMILASNALKFIISTINGEFIDATLLVIKQLSLSDNILIANQLIDLNVLDNVLYYSNMRKKLTKMTSFLILSNLSYNDANLANKIVDHKVINRVINGLITLSVPEKTYCMSVLLNLQATGNDQVFKKLIQLGLVQIICNLIDTEDVKLLRQFLDCILRFLNFGREMQQADQNNQNIIIELLNQQNIGPRLEKIFQESKDAQIQETLQKIQNYI